MKYRKVPPRDRDDKAVHVSERQFHEEQNR